MISGSPILIYYLIPLALGIPHFSVSVSNACAADNFPRGIPIKSAIWFALAALAFFSLGLLAASLVESRLDPLSIPWVVFLFFIITAMRMILHGWQKKALLKVFEIQHVSVVLALALALGINLFFAGVAVYFLKIHTVSFALSMGIMIFFLSFGGLIFGKQFGEERGWLLEVAAGALVLAFGLGSVMTAF